MFFFLFGVDKYGWFILDSLSTLPLHSGSFRENHSGLKSTVSDWQPPLIFVRFTWNFFYMCTYCAAHAQEVSGKSDKDQGGLSVGDSRFQTTVIFAKTTTVHWYLKQKKIKKSNQTVYKFKNFKTRQLQINFTYIIFLYSYVFK